jgi:hypothetical protein
MGTVIFGIAFDGGTVEFTAGEHVRGAVFADVDEELHGDGSEVSLVFSGQETTKVVAKNTTHDNRSLIRVMIPLNSAELLQENRIVPGKYKLPFDLELPSFLPSSMNFSHEESNCAITYTFKAILGSGVLWNYNFERVVVVRAKPMDFEPLPYNPQPMTKHVNLLCCFDRGSIHGPKWVTHG